MVGLARHIDISHNFLTALTTALENGADTIVVLSEEVILNFWVALNMKCVHTDFICC